MYTGPTDKKGAPVRRHCPICGKEERSKTDSSFFCKACGVLMDPNDPNNPPYPCIANIQPKKIKKIVGGITVKIKTWPWRAIICALLTLLFTAIFIAFFNAFSLSWPGILALCGLGAIIIGTSILFLNETKKELPANALKTGIWLNRAGATALAIALIFGFFIPNFSPVDKDITLETETETETETEPIIVVPTTPAIYATIGTEEFGNQGEYLNTELGERMTFTNRKVVVPDKAWNETLNESELKAVETTWVNIKLDVAEGTTAVVFAGGLEQGVNRYENGVLLTLKPGTYEFKLRNGEIVLWYPSQETYQANDFNRIIDQIRSGNFDIKSELEFFGVTADLLPSLPDDLVKERNVQIVPDLKPITITK